MGFVFHYPLWSSIIVAAVVLGLFPGAVLRILVQGYPKNDPRRSELIAELYVLSRVERVIWVVQQVETVLYEGVPLRLRAIKNAVRSNQRRAASISKDLADLQGVERVGHVRLRVCRSARLVIHLDHDSAQVRLAAQSLLRERYDLGELTLAVDYSETTRDTP